MAKNYNRFAITKVAPTTEAKYFGIVEGWISKKGVESSTFKAKNGEERNMARFNMSLVNRADAIAKTMGIDKSLMLTNMSGENEYASIRISAFGFAADYAIKSIKAGQLVRCFVEFSVTESNGKKYLNVTALENPEIVVRAKTENSAPGAEATHASEPEMNVVAEPVYDVVDVDDDDLPF